MSEDGHNVVPDASRNSDIESSRKKTILTAEEEDEIKKLEWRHHVEIGDLLTKGEWNKKHQDKIASCIPSNLQGKTVLDIGFNDGYFSFLGQLLYSQQKIGPRHPRTPQSESSSSAQLMLVSKSLDLGVPLGP